MHRFARPASSSSRRASARGLTLLELLVTLVILSILAAAAIPYAEVTVRRDKELELRRALREIRVAIDTYHDDWLAGRIPKTGSASSDDGYPKTLKVLVEGAEAADAKGGKRRYLRNIPRDPFAEPTEDTSSQWLLRGYQDDWDSVVWNGKDVYDVRSVSPGVAIDGTKYKDW